MSFQETEIALREGIGQLLFGMSDKEVIQLLGDPDERETVQDDEDEIGGTNLHYDNLGLSLSFEEGDDLTLTSISTTEKRYTVRGTELVGMAYDKFVDTEDDLELGPMGYDNITEEGGPKQVVLEFLEQGISFWFDDDVLTEIQWGPVWQDGNDLWTRESETKIKDKMLDYEETYGDQVK
jgi:hypothetical protein